MTAQLDKPILPPMLYRYRPLRDANQLNLEIKAIKEEYLWCASYRQMNDPMEGFYAPSSRVLKQSSYAHIAREIATLKRSTGFCCLSDGHAIELMWSHYATNYAGICVGFRTKQLLEGLPDDVHLVRLSYGTEPPPIGVHEINDPQDASLRILSHKKSSWSYEREWRVISPRLGRQDISSKGCVRELYLGSRIDPQKKAKLLSELKHTSIRIYEMAVSDYTHKFHRLDR